MTAQTCSFTHQDYIDIQTLFPDQIRATIKAAPEYNSEDRNCRYFLNGFTTKYTKSTKI